MIIHILFFFKGVGAAGGFSFLSLSLSLSLGWVLFFKKMCFFCLGSIYGPVLFVPLFLTLTFIHTYLLFFFLLYIFLMQWWETKKKLKPEFCGRFFLFWGGG